MSIEFNFKFINIYNFYPIFSSSSILQSEAMQSFHLSIKSKAPKVWGSPPLRHLKRYIYSAQIIDRYFKDALTVVRFVSIVHASTKKWLTLYLHIKNLSHTHTFERRSSISFFSLLLPTVHVLEEFYFFSSSKGSRKRNRPAPMPVIKYRLSSTNFNERRASDQARREQLRCRRFLFAYR